MSQNSILLITHELTYTGSPRSLYNLAKCLLEEGHRVTVWSFETGDFFAEFTGLGINVTYIDYEEFKSEHVKKAISSFDLVIANTVFCAAAAYEAQKYTKTVLLLGEARNIKRIVSDHSLDIDKIKAVKNIACVSVYAKKALSRFLDRNDITILHNYVENYNHRGEARKPDEKKIRFIVSGTVEQRKGQDIAIAAFKSLPEEMRAISSFYIVGKAPTWSQKYFKSLDFGDGIFYRNEIQNRIELFEYYKKTDVFIVSSRDEACSMFALEGAMLGKALIISTHVGASYICDKKYRFKSGDAKALREKMELFLKEPALITEAGKENRKRYRAFATKENTKNELRAYFKKLGITQEADPAEATSGKGDEKNSEIEKLKREIKRMGKGLKTGGKPVIPVVFATDTNYAPFAAAVIRSIVDNKSADRFYSIYVMYDDSLTYGMYRILNEIKGEGFSVRLIDVSNCVEQESLYLSGHYSMQMYYRWLIPEIFAPYDKVLYLDCDLAIRQDVAGLYDIEIGKNYVGMVNNTVRTSFKNYVEENLGLPVDDYFNSGVILFNTKAFTAKHIKEKCVEYINRDRDLLCPDQDAINVCCKGHIYRLPDKWNFQWHHMIPGVEIGGFTSDYKQRYDKTLSDGPAIIHYTSYKKPWNEPGLKLADVFWKYFREIPGYDRLMRKFAYGKKGIERSAAAVGPAGRVEDSIHYKERIDFLQNSLDETRNSVTYKIGRAITAVPRRVRHMLTGAPV